jgi:hypothetical protein
VKAFDLVGLAFAAEVAEVHGPSDLLRSLLACLDLEADLRQERAQLAQDCITRQAEMLLRLDRRPRLGERTEYLVHPCRRAGVQQPPSRGI